MRHPHLTQPTPVQQQQGSASGACNVFARITKVDEAKRLVYGRMTQEVVDKSGEIFDYEGSKPYFEAWSKSFVDATAGKSFGNVRAMHNKIAAGKLAEPLVFNDAEKAIDICAKVTDDNEWPKCLDGTYTGFSIGGGYVSRTAEKVNGDDVTRFVANPAEVSLVDNPCVPTAKFFDIVKADGVIEKVAFKLATPEPEPIEVKGTDAEVAEFGKALNDAGMTLADAIALVTKGAPAAAAPATIEEWVAQGAALIETATKALQTRLDDPALSLADAAAIAKEYDEPLGEDFAKRVLAKAKDTSGHVQKVHDMLGEMGASCSKAAAAPADVTKAVEPNVELTTLRAELAQAQKDITALKAQPMPHAVTLRTVPVSKVQDSAAASADVANPPDLNAIELTPADYVRNTDGSVDYYASKIQKAYKLRMAQA